MTLVNKLAVWFTGAFKDLKPHNWCLTEEYLQYTQQDDPKWLPDADYYMRLVSRLVDSIRFENRLFALCYFTSGRVVECYDESVSVCVSVCLSTSKFLEPPV